MDNCENVDIGGGDLDKGSGNHQRFTGENFPLLNPTTLFHR